MHGYGSYGEHMAHIAKFVASAGYDVYAMDMRGFGHSEGDKGIIEKAQHIYDDYWMFIFEVVRKYRIN